MADRPPCRFRASDPSPSGASEDRRSLRGGEGIRLGSPCLRGDRRGFTAGNRDRTRKGGGPSTSARNEPLSQSGDDFSTNRFRGQELRRGSGTLSPDRDLGAKRSHCRNQGTASGPAASRPLDQRPIATRRGTKPLRLTQVVPQSSISRKIPRAPRAPRRRTGPIPDAPPLPPRTIDRGRRRRSRPRLRRFDPRPGLGRRPSAAHCAERSHFDRRKLKFYRRFRRSRRALGQRTEPIPVADPSPPRAIARGRSTVPSWPGGDGRAGQPT
jgi:hypothetical protein